MEILYNDDYVLVLDKPVGLLVHRSPLSSDKDTVVDRLKNFYAIAPSPVHRLDRPTSGALICAYTGKTAKQLGESFTNGEVVKKYYAIVRGFSPEKGEITIPLKKDGEGELQESRTQYKSIKQVEIPVSNNRYKTSRYSLIEVWPKTGRFHQIRRHLARIGHPVIGDTSHGDLRHNRIFQKYFGSSRLLLHAGAITFPHPETGEFISVIAPIPEEMEKVVSFFNYIKKEN